MLHKTRFHSNARWRMETDQHLLGARWWHGGVATDANTCGSRVPKNKCHERRCDAIPLAAPFGIGKEPNFHQNNHHASVPVQQHGPGETRALAVGACRLFSTSQFWEKVLLQPGSGVPIGPGSTSPWEPSATLGRPTPLTVGPSS